MPNDLVTARIVAGRFGVSVATVNRWVREHRIPFIRPSRRIVRFNLESVETAISESARTTDEKAVTT